MLHNTPDSSNSEVIIMFPGQFAIDLWVNDEYLSYIKILLLQLVGVEAIILASDIEILWGLFSKKVSKKFLDIKKMKTKLIRHTNLVFRF